MNNLIEMLAKQVTPELIRQASGLVGESESKTQSAVDAIVPSLIGILATKGANEAGANQLLDLVRQQKNSDDLLSNLGNMLGGDDAGQGVMDAGGGILQALLGNNLNGVVELIASVAGIKSRSSSSLMSLLAPVAVAMIGKMIKGERMGAMDLVKVLAGQGNYLQRSAPSGLGSLLGLSNFADLGNMTDRIGSMRPTMPSVSMPAMEAPKASGGSVWRWLVPLLLILALGYFLYTMLGGAAQQATNQAVDAAGAAADKAVDAAGAAADKAVDAAGAAVDAATDAGAAAVCTGLGTLDEAIQSMPEIKADTEVSVIKDAIAKFSAAYDTVVAAAKAANIADFQKFSEAVDSLTKMVSELPGAGAVGDAAEKIMSAIKGVTDAGGALKTQLACK